MIRHLAARALRSLADALDGVTESDVMAWQRDMERKVGRLALEHDHTRAALAAMLREGIATAERAPGHADIARRNGATVVADPAVAPVTLARARELLRSLEARP